MLHFFFKRRKCTDAPQLISWLFKINVMESKQTAPTIYTTRYFLICSLIMMGKQNEGRDGELGEKEGRGSQVRKKIKIIKRSAGELIER